MDEPRTHLVLRELVQLVHLPLVVVPHGPGRARARTASRGAGPSERCRTVMFGLFSLHAPSICQCQSFVFFKTTSAYMLFEI